MKTPSPGVFSVLVVLSLSAALTARAEPILGVGLNPPADNIFAADFAQPVERIAPVTIVATESSALTPAAPGPQVLTFGNAGTLDDFHDTGRTGPPFASFVRLGFADSPEIIASTPLNPVTAPDAASALAPIVQQTVLVSDDIPDNSSALPQPFVVTTNATGISGTCAYNGGSACYWNNADPATPGEFKPAGTAITPEPSSFILLATGAFALLGIATVRQRLFRALLSRA